MTSCGDDLKGTFNICEEAQKYMVDTTIKSFRMVDNYGITETFYMHNSIWYEQHLYYYIAGEAYFQHFGVAYSSVLNDYMFMVTMRADDQDTYMELEWNQRERFGYYFKENRIQATPKPTMSIIASLEVNGFTYFDVIKVDYTAVKDQKDPRTPLITYFASRYGLIKLVVNESVTMERLVE
jgi:hypothetical protein